MMQDDEFDSVYSPKKAVVKDLQEKKANKTEEFLGHIKLMFHEETLSFLTKSQFLSYIKGIVNKELYEEFQPIFQIEFFEFLNKVGKQKSQYRFPIVDLRSKEMLEPKISLFVAQYITQYKLYVVNLQNQENEDDLPSIQIPFIKTKSLSQDNKIQSENSKGKSAPKNRKIEQSSAQEDENKNLVNQGSHKINNTVGISVDYISANQQIKNDKATSLTRKKKKIIREEIYKKFAFWKINIQKKIINQPQVVEQEDQNIVVGKYYQVPNFLTIKQKSFWTLISDDVTCFHQEALNNVIKLISKQLCEDKKDGLLQTYLNFVKQYIIFRTIKHHQWENQSNADQIFYKTNCKLLSYLQQRKSMNLQELKESSLLKSWKYIFKKLPQLLQQKQEFVYQNNLKKHIRQRLQQGLKRISLIRSYNPNLYGVTSKNYIMINVNRFIAQKDKEFRQETIKPYLYICIIHELTHFILRQLKDSELQQYKRSFSSSHEISFGERFMSEFVQRINRFPKYLKIRQRKLMTNFNSLNNEYASLEKKTLEIQKELITLKSKGIFNKEYFQIKHYLRGRKQLSKLLCKINLKSKDQFMKNWNEIQIYIDKMVSNHDNLVDDQSQSCQSQHAYRIFFMIFLTQEIVFELFSDVSQEEYVKCKNKLFNFKGNKYYIEDNRLINLILQQLNQSILANANGRFQSLIKYIETPVVIKYQKFILQQKISLDQFKLKISSYIKQFQLQELNIQKIIENYQEWKNLAESQMIQQIDLKQFISVQTQQYLTKDQITRKLLDKKQASIIPQIIQLETYCGLVTSFLHYFQLITIYYQLPIFFNPTLSKDIHIQSGYQMELIMFPNALKEKIVYSINYQNMKKIEQQSQRNKIGLEPQDTKERQMNIFLYRQGEKSKPYVDLRFRECLNDTYPEKREEINKRYEFWLKCKDLVLQARKQNVTRSQTEWQEIVYKLYQTQYQSQE